MIRCNICGIELQSQQFITDPYGNKICYDCCAKMDREMLHEEDTALLFFDKERHEVTNEPRTLRIPVDNYKEGKHRSAKTIITIWFSVDNTNWWGKVYGDKSNLAYCHKLQTQH